MDPIRFEWLSSRRLQQFAAVYGVLLVGETVVVARDPFNPGLMTLYWAAIAPGLVLLPLATVVLVTTRLFFLLFPIKRQPARGGAGRLSPLWDRELDQWPGRPTGSR
jgi:hypothetical protein